MIASRPAENRAMEVARRFPGQRLLGVTLGRAQGMIGLASERPDATAVCWMLDLHHAGLVPQHEAPQNFTVCCEPDAPPGTFDLAVLPFSMRGEAELTRDILQVGADRLEVGGVLVASTDNPRDTWLHEQLATLIPKIETHRFDDSTVYTAVKRAPIRKLKNFWCEFVYRDGQRLLTAISRPGVFSHRHVDPGARRLLAVVVPFAGARVLDIGCGAGTVGLAVAARDPGVQVHAVDCHTRAVQCTRLGAERNGLLNLTAELNASGEYSNQAPFDIALTNPPYYSDHVIAARMVEAAHMHLAPAGRLLAVTKDPQWYEEYLRPSAWREVTVIPDKGYCVVSAKRYG